MLTFFLLFDLPTQIVIFSPFLMWALVAPKWHPYVLAWAALIWTILVIIMVWKYRSTIRADKAKELPQGDWRWESGLSSARYANQVRLYLHNFGWTALTLEDSTEDSVTFSARKDRLQVLLRCLRDETLPSLEQIDAVSALKTSKGAGLACLLLPAKPGPALVREAAAHGVQVMPLQDMAFMDDPDGPAAFARLRGR